MCFCNAGFQLATDGLTCEGIQVPTQDGTQSNSTLLEMLGKLHWVNDNLVYVGQLFPNFLLYAFTQHVSKINAYITGNQRWVNKHWV